MRETNPGVPRTTRMAAQLETHSKGDHEPPVIVKDSDGNVVGQASLLSSLAGSRAALRASQQELAQLEKKSADDFANDLDSLMQVETADDERLAETPPENKSAFEGESELVADDQDFDTEDAEATEKFAARQKKAARAMFAKFREEASAIDEGVQKAETEIVRKTREAFAIGQNDRAIMRQQELQRIELESAEQAHRTLLAARRERKLGKIAQRKIMRDTKARDTQIISLELANAQLEIVNQTLRYKRRMYDRKTEMLEATHAKQRRQLPQAHERRLACDKQLLQLEMMPVKDEVIRQSMLKKFRMRTQHQKAIDKRIADQLLAFQAVELRQAKEEYELDIFQFEADAAIVARNLASVGSLQAQQTRELNAEKERLLVLREESKQAVLQKHHEETMRRTAHNQRLKIHKEKALLDKAIKAAAVALGAVDASRGTSAFGTSSNSTQQSGHASGAQSPQKSRLASRSGSQDSIRTTDSYLSTDTANSADLEELNVDEDDAVVALASSIKDLVTAQRRARQELRKVNKVALDKATQIAEEKRAELFARHGPELEQLAAAQQLELAAVRAVQEKEMAMEESVHDAEANALLERKTLNFVLNAVGDGIINMDPKGKISRVNQAIETMFGYEAEDVLGRDVRLLVPVECRKNGKGAVFLGQRRDGSKFPCHVAISEVVADGVHLFTGILRDITHERAEAAKAAAIEQARQLELQAAKNQADDLLQRMFPASVASQLLSGVKVVPEDFKHATVFFSDIVGFTEIASRCSAIQMVDFFNDLYSAFDTIIAQYDAYKVETIGDCYMVVSGCPKPNGDLHAGEIAKMALHLVSAVPHIRFKGQPDLRIQIRVGICTGPVAAGVVGNRMPRYCLFGNTVNVASRMESNGAGMHIQCSESAYTALQRLGGYEMQRRGDGIDIKGKGKMQTYWLTAKEGFEHAAPPPTVV
ncbi:hypothetical protein HDU86_005852 [Geranomyces michiganensis]|nr:hypothetical protein HDU86_005852 [Geranomyces michiganensis]